MLVGDLLHLSPLRVIAARPDNSIVEAAKRMARFGVGIVVVMGEEDEIVGVLSERDVVIGIASAEGTVGNALVRDWMTESVVTISPKDSIADAARIMNVHSIRHLVAVERGRPVGVVSIRDVLRVVTHGDLEQTLPLDAAQPAA
jgi:CBS domain-containing protein